MEPWGLALGFGRRATYSHIERLQTAGLAMRLYDREGSVLAITAAGRRRVQAEGGEPRLRVLRGVGLRHARAVSWVAAMLTVRDRTWLNERELRNRPDWLVPVFLSNSSGTHRPDVGAEVGGRRVAVEVELSHKPPRRLRAILAGYEALIAHGTLDGVLYVSDRDDVLHCVTRAAQRAGVPASAFRTRTLDQVQDDLRSTATSATGGSLPGVAVGGAEVVTARARAAIAIAASSS